MQIIKNLRQAFRLFADPRVPFAYKVIPVLALLYVLFPFDIIGDYLPILGQLDDAAVLMGSVTLFSELAHAAVSKKP